MMGAAVRMLFECKNRMVWGSEMADSRRIDDDLLLLPYYPEEALTLEWYQDLELCRQLDNMEQAYDLQRLRSMYEYLAVKWTKKRVVSANSDTTPKVGKSVLDFVKCIWQ
ncbi:MAG: hypothetical protein QM296_02080 [Bacillota bacterium]|nr:hypothetical protein [Bacillota bacterium]